MSLGDIGAFQDWLTREDPPSSLLTAVRGWIEGLDRNSTPWQVPSLPVAEMSVAGEYQEREAAVAGVDIIYSEDFQTGIDLIHVGSHP